MAAALVGAWLGFGSPQLPSWDDDSVAPTSTPRGEREASTLPGGWISIIPLGVGVPGPGATADLRVLDQAVRAGYRWGFSAGVSFEPVEHLLLNAAGAFDQTVWIFDEDDHNYELCFRGDCYGWTERGLGHFMRLGLDLRAGYGSRWVLAWVLAGAHLGVSRVRLDCDNSVEDHCSKAETDLGPGLGGGLGLALRPTTNFAIGLEASIDHTTLGERDDPFRAVRTWDLALIVIVRF